MEMARPAKQDLGDSFRIQLRTEWRDLLDALVEEGEAGSAADLARDFIKKGLLQTYGAATIREAMALSRQRANEAFLATRNRVDSEVRSGASAEQIETAD